MKQIEPENVVVEDEPADRTPWRFRKAHFLATVTFSFIFVVLLFAELYFLPLQSLVGPNMPKYRVALGETIIVTFLGVASAVVSAIIANYIVSLFLKKTLKRAVPYPLVMQWVGLVDRDSILGLIRLHELHVYVSKRQVSEETVDLPCRMVPLFLLPAYPPIARWALRLFEEIYFDMDEIETVFGNNLDTVRRARPDLLLAEGSLTKETAAKLKIILSKEEGNRGADGRLKTAKALNDYCRLHAFTVTALAVRFLKKWPQWKTKGEKLITHDSIHQLTENILNEHSELRDVLVQLKVKGNPWLPAAMKDFFRHAMPDEMVDWRNGKPSLEDLIGKYLKGEGESQEDGPVDSE